MYVARVLYPIEVLGPGKRIGIWFCGCPRRCKGCSNSELWTFQERYRTTPEQIYSLVSRIAAEYPVDGFTITGGDPMYQPEELQSLIGLIKHISQDILVYTGYKIDELTSDMIRGISVLIDGEYIESRNNNSIIRGSDNQKVHILDDQYREKYVSYLISAENQIQNFMTSDGIVSVGIHKPRFMDELAKALASNGISDDPS